MINNKLFFSLLISFCLVLLSVSSVFAGNSTNVTVSFNDGDLSKDLILNQTIEINGTLKADVSGNTIIPDTTDGDILVYWWHTSTNTWNLINGTIDNSKCTYSNTDGSYNYKLNLKSNFLPKGTSYLKVVFKNNTDIYDSSESTNIIVNLFSKLTIYVVQPKDAKVAKLQNYTVIVVDEDGTTPIAGIDITYTDIHGNKIIVTTNNTGEAIFQIMLEKTTQLLMFSTPEMRILNTYQWYLATYNNFTPYPVSKGDVNLTIAIDSSHGYVMGQTALITWNITGPLSFDGKYLIILMYENGKLQHSYSVLAIDGYSYYTWKKSHKTLDIILVYPEVTDYSGAQSKISTFVDQNSTSRSTKINITGINNLIVGKKCSLIINVLDYMGMSVKYGQVILQFDDYDPFFVDIIDGVANFTHVYLKAGSPRNLTINYIGEAINAESTIALQVNVTQGNTIITTNMTPTTSLTDIQTIITAQIDDLAINDNKSVYVKFEFIENGILQHTIKEIITKTGLNTGIAELNYIFKKPHNNLSIIASMEPTNNYKITNGKFETIINVNRIIGSE